jgi:hypothetical protein
LCLVTVEMRGGEESDESYKLQTQKAMRMVAHWVEPLDITCMHMCVCVCVCVCVTTTCIECHADGCSLGRAIGHHMHAYVCVTTTTRMEGRADSRHSLRGWVDRVSMSRIAWMGRSSKHVTHCVDGSIE